VTTGKLYKQSIEIFYLSLIAGIVAIALLFAQKSAVISIFPVLAFLTITSWLISRLNLHYYFLMVLAFTLPFSFEIPITGQVKIFLPGEPMLAIAIFTLGWEIVKKPLLLTQLFAGESRWAIPLLMSFLIATAFSSMLLVSVKFSIINLSYILVFFLWQKLLFKNRPDIFLKLLVLFSLSQLAVLAFSIYQFSVFNWNPVTIKGIFRPFYKDHTILGASGAILGAFWLLYATKPNPSKQRLFFVVLGMVFFGSVLLSFSRAAFLSFLFFILVFTALNFHVRIKHIAAVIVLVIITIGFYRVQVVQFLSLNKNLSHDSGSSYLERIESSGNISTDISNIERLNRWYAGIKMSVKKPLTGFGPGTYQFEYIPYQSPELMNRLTVKNYWHIPENSGGTAHSEYVLALSEMGFFGLGALFLLFGRWFWVAFEKARMHPQRKNLFIAFAVLSTYLFHAAFNNFLNTDKLAFLFWSFAAWMAANYELQTNSIPGLFHDQESEEAH